MKIFVLILLLNGDGIVAWKDIGPVQTVPQCQAVAGAFLEANPVPPELTPVVSCIDVEQMTSQTGERV